MTPDTSVRNIRQILDVTDTVPVTFEEYLDLYANQVGDLV